MSESFVWKYFVKNQLQDSAVCKMCKAEIKCKGWSTSGFIRHLRSTHNIHKSGSNIYKKYQSNCRKKGSQQNATSFLILKPDPFSLQEIVSKLVTLDGIPINCIAKSEFIRQSLMDKGFTLPKNATDIRDLVYLQYKRIKETLTYKFEQQITSGARFSISLDEYTSLNNRQYLSINVHGEEGKFWNLGMVRISSSLTPEVVANFVIGKLAEFQISLERHIVACVTDGSAVMNKMGRIIECDHQLCYAHGIHLAVCDALYPKSSLYLSVTVSDENKPELRHEYDSDESEEDFNLGIEIESAVLEYEYCHKNLFEVDISSELYDIEVSQIINKVRKTAEMFLRSPLKNSMLQEYVKQDYGRPLNLILDSKIKWNSLLAMLERYIEIRPYVLKTLMDLEEDKNSAYTFEKREIDIILDIVASLEPLKLAIEKLGRRESNLLTADDISCFVLKELKQLNTPFSRKLRECLLRCIKERRNTKVMDLLLYLTSGNNHKKLKSDTNFTTLSDANLNARQLYDRLFGEHTIYDSSKEEIECLEESETDTSLGEMSVAQKLDAYLEASERSRTTQDQAASNRKLSDIEQLESELIIFEKTGVKTEKISMLLRALKTIPPTSVVSERAFSGPGLFVTNLRTRLSDQSIDCFCFLKSYYQNSH